MPRFPNEILHGNKYKDGDYEYRNVILSKEAFKKV